MSRPTQPLAEQLFFLSFPVRAARHSHRGFFGVSMSFMLSCAVHALMALHLLGIIETPEWLNRLLQRSPDQAEHQNEALLPPVPKDDTRYEPAVPPEEELRLGVERSSAKSTTWLGYDEATPQ